MRMHPRMAARSSRVELLRHPTTGHLTLVAESFGGGAEDSSSRKELRYAPDEDEELIPSGGQDHLVLSSSLSCKRSLIVAAAIGMPSSSRKGTYSKGLSQEPNSAE